MYPRIICNNYTYISKYVSKCKALEELGIQYIPGESRNGNPCGKCQKEWINGDIPTKETLTPSMQKILSANNKIPLPTITEQAVSVGKSLVEWAFNGFQNVPQHEAELRINICKENKCGMYDAESDRCNACGCKISGTSLTPGKANFSHEQCPANLWPQLGKEIINNAPKVGCRSCGGQ